MNFIDYCNAKENQGWINEFLYTMKAEDGFDADAIVEAVIEQAEDEDLELTHDAESDYEMYFATWYDELDFPISGAV